MEVSLTNAASDEVVTIDDIDYRVIEWAEDGSLEISGGSLNVEYLVVGGGGGGGSRSVSGGGGAGGLLTNVGGNLLSLSGSISVTVGSGGTGGPSGSETTGDNGGSSSISSLVEAEGGGGGGASNNIDGQNGGSGGGGGGDASGGLGTSGQGNDGGSSVTGSTTFVRGGGGGGGAASNGSNGSTGTGGGGGAGLSNSITGTSITYAGGGGGGGGSNGGSGGAGGGGNGGGGTSNGSAGTDGRGGGGGGSGSSRAGGKGGDGVVIIRYAIDQLGSGSGDFVEPEIIPTSTIFGQFGLNSTLSLSDIINIDAKFGIVSFVENPAIFTEGLAGIAPRPIEEDLTISTSSAIPPAGPPGTQPQIVDKRWASAPARKTVIVDLDGTPEDEGFLSTALQGDITWTKSSPSQWTVSLPINSVEAQQFLQLSRIGTYTPFKELQLWRGRQLLVWGPVTNMAVNDDTLDLTGSDASWYLTRRFVGPVSQTNLLPDRTPLGPGLNSWFTSVFRGWDNTFTSNSADINVTGARIPRDPNQWAIRIEDRNPVFTNDPDCTGFVSFPSAFQIMGIPKQKIPTQIEFSCLIEVEQLISRNDESSAIGIGLFPTNARDLRDLIDVTWAQVGNDFPVRKRERLTASMLIPADRDTFAVLMVRGPKGVSYLWGFNVAWDGGLISVNERRDTILRKVVDHVSGNPSTTFREAKEHPFRPFTGPANYGKTDVKIKVASLRSSGRTDRVYEFNQNIVGLPVITELAEIDDTHGWKMVNSDADRTLTVFNSNSPRWDCALRYTSAGGNIFDFQWQYLGEQAANNIAVISSQNAVKSSGELIFAEVVDDARDRNWASLEEVSTAPDEITDEQLEQYARDRWRAVSQPVALSVETSAVPLLTQKNITPGDLLPVTINHGALKITGLFRVYSMTLKADDTLSLTLTPYSQGNLQQVQ